MNAPALLTDWTDANQRLLVAEFGRLAAQLGEGDATAATRATAAARAAMPAPAAIDQLAELFELSAFERDLLLLAVGVELDARLATLCSTAQGAPQRPWASFGLALAALPEPHWSAIAPQRPLRRWQLLEVTEGSALSSARLRVDERVLHFIAGINELDYRLVPLLSVLPLPALLDQAQQRAVSELADALCTASDRPSVVVLHGDDRAGQRDVAAALARKLGLGLLRVHASDLPLSATEQAAFATLWTRESLLLNCALLIDGDHMDASSASALNRLIERLPGLVVMCATDPALDAAFDAGPHLRRRIDCAGAAERLRLWQNALGARATTLEVTVEQLAGQYRLGARRIAEIAAQVGGEDAAADARLLHDACRGHAAAPPGLAQRIRTQVGWGDLVLPPAQHAQLQQIAVHVRHRFTVLQRWGFAHQGTRGTGLAALFWGDSGTGKTLAAEVLANELELALFRIDLSAVVSKYIGETEKNLRQVFDAAEASGAILLFDEADALFGKRSEVKDSHDRYANIEVSYLLQRMEAYSGLAILTSNHKSALDPAFQRRLRFVVHFPFPDQVQREGIWRAVFPASAPLAASVDFSRLARLDAAGGSIRNIALNAAFLAAEAGGAIGMAELRHAAMLEAAKRERPFSDAELRGWV